MRKRIIRQRNAWFLESLHDTLDADLNSTLRHRVKRCQQWAPFSCTAAVLQIVADHVSAEPVSHGRAIKLMDCEPRGAFLEEIPKAIRSMGVPLVVRHPVNIDALKRSISNGAVAIACDHQSHVHDHAILITGFNAQGFWLIDPLIPFPQFRPTAKFEKTCGEFITVKKRRSR